MPSKSPRLSPAQLRALEALPVEVGAYGAPRWPTLRALIDKGLARRDRGTDTGYGDHWPDVVLTDAGRALLEESLRSTGIALASKLTEDQRRALVRVYTDAPLEGQDRDVICRTMAGVVNGPSKAMITSMGLAAAKYLSEHWREG